MHATREDLESIDSRSLHQYREQLYCYWGMERSFRFLDIDSSYGSDLETADGEHEEDRCCGCVRYWSIVSHEENQSRGIYEFRVNVLTASSACVASVVRLAYTIDLLYTSDETYSIIKVGLWK